MGSAEHDRVGGRADALTNGNYVISSSYWSDGKGAITWGNGATGLVGSISAANSMLGSTAGDQIGIYGATELSNGNYVVSSPLWSGRRGAVTWGSGTSSLTGAISASNSLVGLNPGDAVGDGGAFALANGNYVASSISWSNSDTGAQMVGAATWGNGVTGTSGVVSSANSLVGSYDYDQIGVDAEMGDSSIFALANGNYVVGASNWNGARGSATWASGTGPTSGFVTAANSTTGSQAGDQVGRKVAALANGDYVINSDYWNGYAGAVTWRDGSKASSGVVSAQNSLVGSPGEMLSLLMFGGGDFATAFATRADGAYLVGSAYGGVDYTGYARLVPNPRNLSSAVNAAPGSVTLSPNAIAAAAGPGSTVTLQASDDITLDSALSVQGKLVFEAGDAITLNADISSQATGDAVVLSSGRFINNAGSDAIATPNGRWIIHTDGPANNAFGGLLSGSSAVWGASSHAGASASAPAGNRYAFRLAPTASVTANALSRVYDGSAAFAPTYSASGLIDAALYGNVFSQDALSGALAISSPSKNVGVYAIGKGTLSGPAGYAPIAYTGANATITPRALAIGATIANKTYDATTTATVSAFTTNKVAGDTVNVTGSAAFADKNAGATKAVNLTGLALTGADAGNYSYSSTGSSTGRINVRLITVGLIVSDKVYDGTNAATVTGYTDNRIAGDVISFNAASPIFAGATFGGTDGNVGSNKLVMGNVTRSGADANNYTTTGQASGYASVTPRALTLSGLLAQNKVYDGLTSATLNTSGVSLTGAVSGDDVALNAAGLAGSFADKNVGAGKAVSVSGASLTGAQAGNYTLSSASSATADITPKQLTASGFTAADKFYDRSTVAAVSGSAAALAGVIAGDTVSLNLAGLAGAFADYNAGTAKPVTLSGYALAGAQAGNYALLPSGVAAVTARIAPTFLTHTGMTIADKIYDGSTLGTVSNPGSLTGVVAGDSITVSSANANAVFNTKNAGVNKAVSVTGLQAVLGGGTLASNYNFTLSGAAGTATITPKQLGVTNLKANTRSYNGSLVSQVALTGHTLTGKVAGDSVSLAVAAGGGNLSLNGVATFSDKNVGVNKSVVITGLSLTGTSAGNYIAPNNIASTGTINKAGVGIIGVRPLDKVYDGTATAQFDLTNARLELVFGADQAHVASVGPGEFSDANVGANKDVTATYYLSTLSGADAGNYFATFIGMDNTAAITPKELTLSGLLANNRAYDGTALASLNASGASLSGVVGADSVSFNPATLTGAFADKNAGANKLVSATGGALSGSAAGNYSLAVYSPLYATITQRALNVGALVAGKTYDGTTSASATLTSDKISGDDLSVSGSAAFADKNAGLGKAVNITGVSVSGADAANYSYGATASATGDISQRALSVTASAQNKTYDGTTLAAASFSDNRVSGDALSISGSAAFNDKNAGLGKTVNVSGISLSGADAGNYIANATAQSSADIAQKALSVTGVTAQSKAYDGTTAAAIDASGAVFSGIVNGDDLSLSAAGAAGSFADKNAGLGKSVSISGLSLSGADAANYLASLQTSASANIAQRALSISAAVAAKTYDGSTSASATLSDDRVSGDALTVSASAAFADKNAGLGKTVNLTGVSVSGADAANYTYSSTGSATGDITQRALSVTASAQNRAYTGTTGATLSFSDNRVSGDALVVSGSGSFVDKNVGASKTVNYTYGVSGADAANYAYGSAGSTTATISKAPIIIGVTVADKVYDGSRDVAVVGFTDSRVAGDVFAVNYTTARHANANAGLNKSATVSGLTLSGPDAGNYNPNGSAFDNSNVTPKQLSATGFSASDKTYNGTTAASIVATGAALSGVIGADVVSMGLGSVAGAFSDKNAGVGKSVTVSGITLSGAAAGNYLAPSGAFVNPITANITPKALFVSGVAVNSKVYDGTTAATIASIGALGGAVGGDAVSLNSAGATAAFDDKNVSPGALAWISGLVLSGADASNYSLGSPMAASAAITPKALSVSGLLADNKTYDGTTAATLNAASATLSGAIDGDSIALDASAAAAAFADKNAGVAKTVSVSGLSLSGADAGNYTLSSASSTASADIARRALSVTASAQSKTYDGTISAVASLSDDRVNGDDVSLSGSAAFADKNAGLNKTVNVAGISVTGADADNYIANSSAVATADIAQKALTVSGIEALDKTYDGTIVAQIDASGALFSGIVSGDDLSIDASSAAGSFGDKNAGLGKSVSISGLLLSGADAANYHADLQANAGADITARALNVSALAQNKTYDGTTAAAASLSDDRIAGDDLALSGSAAFADKNAGLGKAVNVTGIALSGADAANYIANNSAQAFADIAARALAVTASAQNKTYDGTTAATAALSDNRVAGDDLTLSASAAFADKNAGAAKTVNVTAINLSGADAGNYIANGSTTASADIAARALAVTASAQNKTYDGTSAATATLSDNRVAGDDLIVSGSAAFSDKNAGLGKTVNVAGISLSGADAANYAANATAQSSADIAQKALTVTGVAAQSKTYDGTAAAAIDASGALFSGMISGDDLSIDAASASGSFADKNAGLGKAVSISGIALSGADAANYAASLPSSTVADIHQRALAISATAQNKTYDGTTAATAALSDNRINGDDLSVAGAASFSDKNAGLGKTVTVSGISLSGADAANYTANSSATASADIAQRALSVAATAQNKTYDGTTAAAAALSDDRINGDDLSLSGSAAFADKNAGLGKTVNVTGIALSGADAGNYIANANAQSSADIAQRALTVAAAAQNKTYDGTTAVVASLSDNRVAGDELALSGSAAFSDKNAGLGKTVNVTGISLSGADAANYIANGSATASADIAARALNVTASAQNKIYDGTTAATATLSDNRVNGDDLALSGSAAFNDKNAGSGKTVTVSGISLSGADAANYIANSSAQSSADIAQKALTVTGVAAQNKTYDGTASAQIDASAALFSGMVSGDELAIDASGAVGSFSDKNAGLGKAVSISGLSLSGADAGNYSAALPSSAAADIHQRALSVSAAAQNKTYDGTTAATASLSDNRINGDELAISGSAAFADKNAGAGKTVDVTGISLSGADAANYIANATAQASADINQRALAVSAAAQSKTYDGTTAATATLSDNRVSGDDLSLSGSAAFADKNAGLGKIVNVTGVSLAGADAGNYVANSSAQTTADIAQKALSVTGVAAQNKTYDGTAGAQIDASGALFSGMVIGDELSIDSAGATGSFADKNAGLGKSVSISGLSLSGADAANYAAALQTSAVADINQRALSVGAAAQNKTYDGTASATATLSDNRVAGDELTLSGSSAFADKNAGAGKTVNVTGISLSGADAGNYVANGSAQTTADIAARALNVSAIAQNKTYDGTAAAAATLSDDRVAGDDLALSGSALFSDKNAGLGKTVNVTGISLSGADAGNYVANNSAQTTADIAARALAVTATAQNKTYDGTSSATASLSDDRVSGDDLALSGSAAFNDKNAGLGKTVNVTGISLSGADAGNYVANSSAQTTADIAQRALTVAAAAQNKTYDGTTAATASLSDDRINGDDLSLSGSAAFADKNAGLGKTVNVTGISLSGADAANYAANATAQTSADIAARALNVAAAAQSKTYDGTTAATAALSDDRVSGDELTLSGSAAFVDKNAGVGKTVNVTGISLSGADAGNYTANATAQSVADIAQKALTVTGVSAQGKTYDGTTTAQIDASGALFSGMVNGDDLSIDASGAVGSFNDKNAGLAKAVSISGLALSGADAGNYAAALPGSASADIAARALNVTATAQNKTYDGATAATTALSDNRISGDDLTLSGSAAFADKNVGSGKTVNVTGIALSGADAGNYLANSSAQTTADIAQRALAVTASAQSKTYDGTIAATAALSDDRISGDALSLSGSAAFLDKNAGLSKTVNVTGISLSGADAGNYVANATAQSSADIAQKALTVTGVAAQNKTYDGTATAQIDASGALFSGMVNGDELSVDASSAVGSFADKNAGFGKTVSISGIALSGADAANYAAALPGSASADIAARALSVTAAAQNKTYDGTTAATAALSDNRVAGDDLSLSGSAAFSDKNAGLGKTVNVTGISLSGADANNYIANATAQTAADIAKKALSIDGVAILDKTYDGSTSAQIDASGAALSGMVNGDDLHIDLSSASAAFADKNAGEGKSVAISGLGLSGADASNYQASAPSAGVAAIKRRALEIFAAAQNKTYDGTADTVAALSDNRVAGDDLAASGSAAFADKSAGLGKTVTVSGISLSGADANNYTASATAQTTADIAQRALTVSASAQNKTYDGTTAATAALSDDRINGDDLSLSGSAAFIDKNAGSAKTVNVTGISLSGADAGNYIANGSATASADIAQRALSVSASAQSKTYDGTTAAAAALSDNRISGDDLALSGSAAFSDKNAGAGKTVNVTGISLSGSDAGNYVANATAQASADIAQKALTVTGVAAQNKTYDGTTTAQIDASGAVFSGMVNGDELSIDASGAVGSFADKNAGLGKAVSISGIALSGADAANYAATLPGSASADIARRALTVSASAQSKTYDGTTAATAALADNRVAGDDLALSGSAAFADKNAGAGKTVNVTGVSLSGADANNYIANATAQASADINQRALSVSASAQNKTYDGTAAAVASLSDDRINGDDLTLSGSAAFSDKNAGLSKTVTVSGISLSGADAANYIANATAQSSADIAQKALSVSGVSAQSKTYDGTAAAAIDASGALFSGMVNGDELSIDASGAAGLFNDKNAGLGKSVSISGLSLSGADAGNYSAALQTNAVADIAQRALAVSASAQNKTYDGTAAAVASLSDDRINGDDLSLSGSAAFSDKNAGLGKTVTVSGIALAGADAANYTVASAAQTTADIAQRALTVAAAAQNKTYDATTAAAASLSDNRIAGDDLTLSGSAAFDDKNAGLGKTVTVAGISLSGADAANYIANATAQTTADIAKASATVVGVTAENKTYDGTASAQINALAAEFDGLFLGDSLSLDASNAVGSFADKNAGANKTVSVSGLLVSGADAGNYIVSTPSSLAADIHQRALTVAALAQNKTYDGTTAATASLSDNRINGDDLALSGSAAFADKNAGLGKTVNVTGISLSGADAANYTVAPAAQASADIATRALSVTASAQNKTYDGTTAATASLSDNRVSGDELTLSGSAAFTDKNAGLGKTVNVTGISLSGADAANYIANGSAQTAADIERRALNVSGVSAQGKTYDGTTAAQIDASGALFSGMVNGDDLSIDASSVSGAFSDKNAGANKSVLITGLSLSGADAANYAATVPSSATADIAQRALAVTAQAQSKTYDGTAQAAADFFDNRLAGDSFSVSGAASFADKNAGLGKTVNVAGISLSGADAGNYIANGSAQSVADIHQRALSVTASAQNKTYDGTASATAALSDNRVNGDELSISGSAAFADKNAGSGKIVNVTGISVAGADAGNYIANATAQSAADIAQKAITVDGAQANDKVYDGSTSASFNLAAASLSGLVAGDSASLASLFGAFADKNAGQNKAVLVTGSSLSGADAGNYALTPPTNLTADITPAAVDIANLMVIGERALDKVYDGTTAAQIDASGATLSGLAQGDLVSLDASQVVGWFLDKNVGSNKTVMVSGHALSGADAANYTVSDPTGLTASITPAPLTVSGAVANNKTYDGSANASFNLSNASLSGLIAGDSTSLSALFGAFSDKNAGVGKAVLVTGSSLSGADAGNYALTPPTNLTADITPAAIDIVNLSVIGERALDKVYDGTTSAQIDVSGAALSGLAQGDSVSLELSGVSGSFLDKNVGFNKTVVVTGHALSGADAANYTVSNPTNLTANITAKTLFVAGLMALDKTYDGSTLAQLDASGASLSGLIAGDQAQWSAGSLSGSFADKNAGLGKTVLVSGGALTGADASNYRLGAIGPLSASVSRAELTVSAVAQGKVYDGSTRANAALFDNRLAGDELSVSGSAAFSDKNAGLGKTVNVTGIRLSGADAGNYAVNDSAQASADIAARALFVTAAAQSKTYDGTSAASVALSDNRVSGDELSVSSSAAFSDKNAGLGKTVNVTGIRLSGADAGNYVANATAQSSADIAQRALSVGAAAQNKTYDGTTVAVVALSDDRINGDDLSLSGSAAFNDKNAGLGKTVNVTGIRLSGADAGNYIANATAQSSADISPKAIQAVGGAARDKIQDGSSGAVVDLGSVSLSGAIEGDLVLLDTAAHRASFESAEPGARKSVTVAGLALSGADAANYELSGPFGLTATIVPKIQTPAPNPETPAPGGGAGSSSKEEEEEELRRSKVEREQSPAKAMSDQMSLTILQGGVRSSESPLASGTLAPLVSLEGAPSPAPKPSASSANSEAASEPLAGEPRETAKESEKEGEDRRQREREEGLEN